MTNKLLLIDNTVVSDLTVQISNYHANATDIAYRTLRNKQLLKECQELFELVKALQNAVADDIKQINTVIEKLEKGMQVDQEDIAKLKASNDPIKSNLPQLQTSLASHGVISSPSDLLTEILDEGERKELELYLNRPLFERTKWTKGDYLAVAACVLVGLALEILNAAWRWLKNSLSPKI
jgi:septal ring factor EnvC (AmiA/AmiB activator)